MNNLERALLHGRELVQPFPGEHPPEHEVTYLEGPGADAVEMVPPQCLLVSRSPKRNLSTMFLPKHEVHPPHGVLLRLVECQDPCGAMPDLVREDRLSSIDKEERGFAGRLGSGSTDGP